MLLRFLVLLGTIMYVSGETTITAAPTSLQNIKERHADELAALEIKDTLEIKEFNTVQHMKIVLWSAENR